MLPEMESLARTAAEACARPDLTMDVEIFLEEKGYSVVISSRIKDDMEFVSVLHFMLHLTTETFKSRFHEISEHARKKSLFKLPDQLRQNTTSCFQYLCFHQLLAWDY
jgi:hypothetical protein